MEWPTSRASLDPASQVLGNLVLRVRTLVWRRESCTARRRCRATSRSAVLGPPKIRVGKVLGPEGPDVLRRSAPGYVTSEGLPISVYVASMERKTDLAWTMSGKRIGTQWGPDTRCPRGRTGKRSCCHEIRFGTGHPSMLHPLTSCRVCWLNWDRRCSVAR